MTYARVVATVDHEARWYVGQVGDDAGVSEGNPKLGLEALLILEFANGMRDVFRAHEVAPAKPGDKPSPEAKPLSEARKPAARQPVVKLKRRATRHGVPAAPPASCVRGHPRADPSEACRECDRQRKRGKRAQERDAKKSMLEE